MFPIVLIVFVDLYHCCKSSLWLFSVGEEQMQGGGYCEIKIKFGKKF